MDFNAIYESIAPYVGTSTIASGIIAIISLAFYTVKKIKEIKETFSSTESEMLKAFKKAIPETLYVSIESLAKAELSKITEEIKQVVDKEFLSQIKANTDLVNAMAKALISMKSVPDSVKKEIADIILTDKPATTESLKVQLLPEEKTVEVKENKKEEILID